jgi:hypothetical protein
MGRSYVDEDGRAVGRGSGSKKSGRALLSSTRLSFIHILTPKARDSSPLQRLLQK